MFIGELYGVLLAIVGSIELENGVGVSIEHECSRDGEGDCWRSDGLVDCEKRLGGLSESGGDCEVKKVGYLSVEIY